MKKMRNILEWFGMAEEMSILQDSQKHVEEACQTVAYFAEAVKAFIQGNAVAKITAIENARESEHRADILRSKMVDELSKGVLLPPAREDLMHFVRSLDRIADWTNGAARLLGFIEERLPQNVLDNMWTATNLIVSASQKLKDSIKAFVTSDLKKALADCEEVGRFEHEADDQKRVLIESIIHAGLKPENLLLCYNLAEYLEGVTDKIEDAADLIKVLAVKSQ
ncbi:MAG: DUF47 family protein [Candidatus Omnitrophica bacterium]|nr:DUF47 family protein [Candidatus Omnitrophota bacterium]